MNREAYKLDELEQVEQNFAASNLISIKDLQKFHQIRHVLPFRFSNLFTRYAAYVIAPILAGFACWIYQQVSAFRNPLLIGVMREGQLINRLLQDLFSLETREVWLNRSLAMRAAFGCGDDNALVNWLVRTRTEPTNEAAALRALGMGGGHPEIRLTADNIASILVDWRNKGHLLLARDKAQGLAARLLRHWHKVMGAEREREILLLDFACVGNIQRSLRYVLHVKHEASPLVGLNLLMTAGSQWAEQDGNVMHGWLAMRGVPDWIAAAYGRTPELMEIFTAGSLPPLEDYRPDGTPLHGDGFLTHQQIDLLNEAQVAIIAAAKFYQQQLGDGLTAELGQCLLGRALLNPLPAEVTLLADWPLDAGLDGRARRVLAAQLDPMTEPWSKAQTAWPAGSRLRNRNKPDFCVNLD